VNPDDDDTGNFQAQRYVGRTVFMRATAGGIAENEAHIPVYYPGTTDPRMAKAIDVQAGASFEALISMRAQCEQAVSREEFSGFLLRRGQPLNCFPSPRGALQAKPKHLVPSWIPQALLECLPLRPADMSRPQGAVTA
jgi:hypothetical protein